MNDKILPASGEWMVVDPVEIGSSLSTVLTRSLAKSLAAKFGDPWTDELEAAMQEKISEFLAIAAELEIAAVRIVVTRPDGVRVSRELDIDLIRRTRSLQYFPEW